jgi:short-subunit dehydrogenase
MASKKLTWLITGCSSGFGLSLVRIAQAGGQNVIATSRNPAKTPELVREVESKGGRWLQLDVNNPDSGQIIDQLESSGTSIDVLVNNAGYLMFAPLEICSEHEIRSMMETAFFGPVRLMKAVVPTMRQRKSGIIANFSTGAALEGVPSMALYSGAKAGLDGELIMHRVSCLKSVNRISSRLDEGRSQGACSIQYSDTDLHPEHL